MLGHECFHDAPSDEVSDAAEAEHDEVTCRLAGESEESESLPYLLGVRKEFTSSVLDEQ